MCFVFCVCLFFICTCLLLLINGRETLKINMVNYRYYLNKSSQCYFVSRLQYNKQRKCFITTRFINLKYSVHCVRIVVPVPVIMTCFLFIYLNLRTKCVYLCMFIHNLRQHTYINIYIYIYINSA